jgi:mannose-6-phosphate isomerase-like protein (cupin superfamily)
MEAAEEDPPVFHPPYFRCTVLISSITSSTLAQTRRMKGCLYMPDQMKKQSVFRPNSLKKYIHDTHRNDLIIDRKDTEAIEAFFTVLNPGQKSPAHEHRDCEQLWYIIEGCGRLVIGNGDELEEHTVSPGDVVLTRRFIHHSVENCGDGLLRYLTVDSFIGERSPNESTWDAHIEVYCREHKSAVRLVDAT